MFTKLKLYFLHSILLIFYRNSYYELIKCRSVEDMQRRNLLRIIRKNRNSKFGVEHGFRNINCVADFQKKVSPKTYDDYLPYIEAMQKGENNILCAEKVLLFEPTSGSTKSQKLIPYTASLKKEFQKGIEAWLYSLYHSNPSLKFGKSYWSISPSNYTKSFTQGGTPIGFEKDSEYLVGIASSIMNQVFAVPQNISRMNDMHSFYLETCIKLLCCRNLTLVSVWHPTYWLLILDFMTQNVDKIVEQMPSRKIKNLRDNIQHKAYHKIWPKLKVISCWADGNAQQYAHQISINFPGVKIQPKGVLATEAFISFPLDNKPGSLLSVNAHFYEFISTKDEAIYLAHELKIGEKYEIMVTTGGGLYRYKMFDVISVVGMENKIALIRFEGKSDLTSDHFGEKLNQQFLIEKMQQFITEPTFYLFAFEQGHYVLFSNKLLNVEKIELALRENYHYDYCRELGQLKSLRLFYLTGDPEKEYIQGCVSFGQKLGDVKINQLSKHSGWEHHFKGYYL